MTTSRHKIIIGRAEKVSFPEYGIEAVPAKIDTGAYRTSVWASNIKEVDGKLQFSLLGPESDHYSGETQSVSKYELISVENSFGHSEKRYSIFMKIKLGTKTVKTNVTLADRSNKTYPILVGRRFLRGKFLVDVSTGDPLPDEENRK